MNDDKQEAPQARRRKPRRKFDAEISAMRKFALALDAMNPDSQRAAIFYFADKYLGIKLWRTR